MPADALPVEPAAAWVLPLLLATAMIAAYALLVGAGRRCTGRRWSRRRTAWSVGVALLAAGLAPPLSGAAHADPRAHMAQHLLVGMFAPIGLVMAAPVTAVLRALPPARRRRAAAVLGSRALHALTRPWLAAALVTGGLLALYLTPLLAMTTHDRLVHAAVLVHLLVSGCLLTWVLVGPDPAPRRPGTAHRAVVLVLVAAVHAWLAKALFADAGQLPPGVTASPERLREAAMLMYYGGDLAELLLAVLLFAGWYRRRGRLGSATSAPDRPHGLDLPAVAGAHQVQEGGSR